MKIGSGTLTPANFANAYFDDGQTGTFPGKAQISEDGNTVYGLVDNITSELVSFSKCTTWMDGTPMSDAKVDGVIYRKKGIAYYKRNYDGPIQAKWFAKGDGVTDVTAILQKAINLAKGSVLNFTDGTYIVSTQAAGGQYVLTIPSNSTIHLNNATIKLAASNLDGYEILYAQSA